MVFLLLYNEITMLTPINHNSWLFSTCVSYQNSNRRRKKDGGEMGSLKKMDSVEQNLQVSSKDVPILYVNGLRRVLPDGLAHLTLLEYLRGIYFFFPFILHPNQIIA
jgi:hypothetical protein